MVTGRGRTQVEDAERAFEGPAARLPAIALVAGPEDYLRDRLVRAFRRGAEAGGAEFLRLEGDDLAAEELAQALASVPLFGDQRRLWIREGSKLDRACEDALFAWADGGGEGARVLVTTSREVHELKLLQSLASKGLAVSCDAGPAERRRWGERMLEELGLKLPGGALEALVERTGSLLTLNREMEKLALHVEGGGRVAPTVLDVLASGRGGASAGRWAEGIVRRDRSVSVGESAQLDAVGEGGSGSLWALAERALHALDPAPFGYDRRGAGSGASMPPARALELLDRVYRADRALKRGEIPDAYLRTYLEIITEQNDHG